MAKASTSKLPAEPKLDPYPNFHLSSLTFPLDPISALLPYQLALVPFHPDATETHKTMAELTFFKLREKERPKIGNYEKAEIERLKKGKEKEVEREVPVIFKRVKPEPGLEDEEDRKFLQTKKKVQMVEVEVQTDPVEVVEPSRRQAVAAVSSVPSPTQIPPSPQISPEPSQTKAQVVTSAFPPGGSSSQPAPRPPTVQPTVPRERATNPRRQIVAPPSPPLQSVPLQPIPALFSTPSGISNFSSFDAFSRPSFPSSSLPSTNPPPPLGPQVSRLPPRPTTPAGTPPPPTSAIVPGPAVVSAPPAPTSSFPLPARPNSQAAPVASQSNSSRPTPPPSTQILGWSGPQALPPKGAPLPTPPSRGPAPPPTSSASAVAPLHSFSSGTNQSSTTMTARDRTPPRPAAPSSYTRPEAERTKEVVEVPARKPIPATVGRWAPSDPSAPPSVSNSFVPATSQSTPSHFFTSSTDPPQPQLSTTSGSASSYHPPPPSTSSLPSTREPLSTDPLPNSRLLHSVSVTGYPSLTTLKDLHSFMTRTPKCPRILAIRYADRSRQSGAVLVAYASAKSVEDSIKWNYGKKLPGNKTQVGELNGPLIVVRLKSFEVDYQWGDVIQSFKKVWKEKGDEGVLREAEKMSLEGTSESEGLSSTSSSMSATNANGVGPSVTGSNKTALPSKVKASYIPSSFQPQFPPLTTSTSTSTYPHHPAYQPPPHLPPSLPFALPPGQFQPFAFPSPTMGPISSFGGTVPVGGPGAGSTGTSGVKRPADFVSGGVRYEQDGNGGYKRLREY